jgi:hypothetical protein
VTAPLYPNPHDRPADLAIWFNPDGSADVVDRVHAGEYGANTCTFKLTPAQADALLALGSVLDEGQAKRLYEWKEER